MNIKKKSNLWLIAFLILTITGCSLHAPNNEEKNEVIVSENKENVKEIKTEPKGERVTGVLYSPTLKLDWNYNVYLPENYDPDKEGGYPVLYMMHGLGGNHTNLLERFDSVAILDEAITETGKEMIVVFPDGFNSFYIDQNDGMQMESAIINDLVPYIDSTYNTDKDRAKRAIGGISMGGYGAARFTLKYPETFSKALLISPAVWYELDSDNNIKKNYHAFSKDDEQWSDEFYNSMHPSQFIDKDKDKDSDVEFYIRSTEGDKTVPIEDVEKFARELDDKNVKEELVIDSDQYDHNWDYWRSIAKDSYKWALESLNR